MATSSFAAPVYFPKFRAFNAAGAPLNAGKLYTYVAGSVSTPQATYPTYADALAGTNANANPVILDANGEAYVFGQALGYKFQLTDSVGTVLWTEDNVYCGVALPGVASAFLTEWFVEPNPIVFGSTTSFTITGVDRTAIYTAGRRIKTFNTGGTIYSTVTSSSFSTNTTVTVVNDSGVLDSGLSALSYGLSYVNPSYLDPRSFFSARLTANQTGFGSSTKLAGWTVIVDGNSEWQAGNNRWQCKYPGRYRITAQAELADTGTGVATTLQISVSGSVVSQAASRSWSTASQITSQFAHYDATLAASDFVELFFLGSANTTVQGTIGTRLSVERMP